MSARPESMAAAEAGTPSLARAGGRSRLSYSWASVSVLWKRDLQRFFRQRSRVAGALLQPLIFWFVVGSGLAGIFSLPGAAQVGYLEFFYPGILVQVVLFTSIFTTMSVIEDRAEGFLQAVMVAPAGRGALVLGKALGGTTIALVQTVLFLLIAPLAGFEFGEIAWGVLALVFIATGLGLTAVGFILAWALDSTQGYHAIMSVLLLPAWVLSTAMFPVPAETTWLAWLMRINPLTYAVDAARRALYGLDATAPGSLAGFPLWGELAVVGALAALSLWGAAAVCNRR